MPPPRDQQQRVAAPGLEANRRRWLISVELGKKKEDPRGFRQKMKGCRRESTTDLAQTSVIVYLPVAPSSSACSTSQSLSFLACKRK